MKHCTTLIIFVFCISLFASSQAFAVPRGNPRSDFVPVVAAGQEIRKSTTLNAEKAKIMSILEDRVEDPEVLVKTGEKLRTLSDEEIRLVSSLCDRISTGERTAQAAIVFSLVTALIVLS